MTRTICLFCSFLFLLALSTGCTQSEMEDVSPDDNSPVLTDNGQWRVSYFWDKDKDETHKFKGYTFTFLTTGVLEARLSQTTVKGSWQVNSSSTKLILAISGNPPLDELSDDWLILEKSDGIIKLRDDNDEHREEIHFSRVP